MMTWTIEREQKLTTMWASGLSASQIANRLGGIFTRSAIIGKVHRMGLPGRATTTRTKAYYSKQGFQRGLRKALAAKPKPKPKPKPFSFARSTPLPPTPIDLAAPLPGAKLIGILDLESHHCRYMHGDKFCGCNAIPGTSWCPDHYRVVYKTIEVSTRLTKTEAMVQPIGVTGLDGVAEFAGEAA